MPADVRTKVKRGKMNSIASVILIALMVLQGVQMEDVTGLWVPQLRGNIYTPLARTPRRRYGSYRLRHGARVDVPTAGHIVVIDAQGEGRISLLVLVSDGSAEGDAR